MVRHEFICWEPKAGSGCKQFAKSLEDTVISRSEILQNAVNVADGLPAVLVFPLGCHRFFDTHWTKTVQSTPEQRSKALQKFTINHLIAGLKVLFRAAAVRQHLFACGTFFCV